LSRRATRTKEGTEIESRGPSFEADRQIGDTVRRGFKRQRGASKKISYRATVREGKDKNAMSRI